MSCYCVQKLQGKTTRVKCKCSEKVDSSQSAQRIERCSECTCKYFRSQHYENSGQYIFLVVYHNAPDCLTAGACKSAQVVLSCVMILVFSAVLLGTSLTIVL